MAARAFSRTTERMAVGGPLREEGPVRVEQDGGLSPPLLRHARLFFEFEPLEPARLPPYLGSTLRGGLMRALRRVACVARGVQACQECPFLHACTYALLFETPRPKWATRYPTLTTIVHPLVIEPEPRAGSDSGVAFAVRLFGRAVTTVPFVIEAARRMALAGLGRARSRFSLVRVRDQGPQGEVLFSADDPAPRWSPSVFEGAGPAAEGSDAEHITLDFLTPTRLVEDSALLRRPSFSAVVRSLVFRAAAMAYFHEGVDWTPDWNTLDGAVAGVREVASETTWVRLNRFSTRQRQEVPLDGFVGRVTYEGPGLPLLRPLVHLGEVLHVGKGTVFGLGRYEILDDSRVAR